MATHSTVTDGTSEERRGQAQGAGGGDRPDRRAGRRPTSPSRRSPAAPASPRRPSTATGRSAASLILDTVRACFGARADARHRVAARRPRRLLRRHGAWPTSAGTVGQPHAVRSSTPRRATREIELLARPVRSERQHPILDIVERAQARGELPADLDPRVVVGDDRRPDRVPQADLAPAARRGLPAGLPRRRHRRPQGVAVDGRLISRPSPPSAARSGGSTRRRTPSAACG